jgi:hypothetical protein
MSQTFEEKLAQLAKEKSVISLSDLGETFKGTILKNEFKSDTRGNEAFYLTIKTATGNVVQKYGKSLYQILSERVKLAGGQIELQTVEHIWKQEKAGRATFNRYFPVPNKETKK